MALDDTLPSASESLIFPDENTRTELIARVRQRRAAREQAERTELLSAIVDVCKLFDLNARNQAIPKSTFEIGMYLLNTCDEIADRVCRAYPNTIITSEAAEKAALNRETFDAIASKIDVPPAIRNVPDDQIMNTVHENSFNQLSPEFQKFWEQLARTFEQALDTFMESRLVPENQIRNSAPRSNVFTERFIHIVDHQKSRNQRHEKNKGIYTELREGNTTSDTVYEAQLVAQAYGQNNLNSEKLRELAGKLWDVLVDFGLEVTANETLESLINKVHAVILRTFRKKTEHGFEMRSPDELQNSACAELYRACRLTKRGHTRETNTNVGNDVKRCIVSIARTLVTSERDQRLMRTSVSQTAIERMFSELVPGLHRLPLIQGGFEAHMTRLVLAGTLDTDMEDILLRPYRYPQALPSYHAETGTNIVSRFFDRWLLKKKCGRLAKNNKLTNYCADAYDDIKGLYDLFRELQTIHSITGIPEELKSILEEIAEMIAMQLEELADQFKTVHVGAETSIVLNRLRLATILEAGDTMMRDLHQQIDRASERRRADDNVRLITEQLRSIAEQLSGNRAIAERAVTRVSADTGESDGRKAS